MLRVCRVLRVCRLLRRERRAPARGRVGGRRRGRHRRRPGGRRRGALRHVDLRIGGRGSTRWRSCTTGSGLRDLGSCTTDPRHPVDELSHRGCRRRGRSGESCGVLPLGLGFVLRLGLGHGGLLDRGGGALVSGVLLVVVLLADGGVLDPAEDGLAEEVVVIAGAVQIADHAGAGGGGDRGGGGDHSLVDLGARAGVVLFVLRLLLAVVDRGDQCHRRGVVALVRWIRGGDRRRHLRGRYGCGGRRLRSGRCRCGRFRTWRGGRGGAGRALGCLRRRGRGCRRAARRAGGPRRRIGGRASCSAAVEQRGADQTAPAGGGPGARRCGLRGALGCWCGGCSRDGGGRCGRSRGLRGSSSRGCRCGGRDLGRGDRIYSRGCVRRGGRVGGWGGGRGRRSSRFPSRLRSGRRLRLGLRDRFRS